MLPRVVAALTVAGLFAGCSLLPGGDDTPPAAVFLLQPAESAVAAAAGESSCNVLELRPVQAAPGFLTDRMLYTRQPSQVEFYSQSRWLDVPSRMIDTHLLERLSRAGVATVVVAGAPVGSQYRLDVTAFRLLQQFDGDESLVAVSFDAALFDTQARRQLALRSFDAREPAGGDARSGVAAANSALARTLDELVRFAHDALPESAPKCN